MSNCTDLLRELEPEFRWGTTPLRGTYTIWRQMDLIDELMRGVGVPKSMLDGESRYSSSRVALETFNKRLVGVRGLQK